jgi:hypothetical protein
MYWISRSWSRDSGGAVYRIAAPLVIRPNLKGPTEDFWSVPFLLDKNNGRFLSQTIIHRYEGAKTDSMEANHADTTITCAYIVI